MKTFASFRIKRSIMLILMLLVSVFVVGMVVMSSLNLDFSQRAMSELRQQQINDTFYANLSRINAHHQLMEQNTLNLARVGELLHRTRGRESGNIAEMERSVSSALAHMVDASAGGLWFSPGEFVRGNIAAFGYRSGSGVATQLDRTAYHERAWYQRVLPDTAEDAGTQPRFFWTPAYYKELIEDVVISLTTVMRDAQGQPIGLASTDWRADDIIRLVSRVDVTPGAFAFLLDGENRNLSSLARAGDQLAAQAKIDAIIQSDLQGRIIAPLPQSAILSGRMLVAPMQTLMLDIEGEQHALFFSRTQAGMVFGMGVPQAEIDAVLLPMRETNRQIVIAISAVVLVLSVLILLIVASILKKMHILYTDALTDLPNREKLLSDLKTQRKGSLLLVNIDAFKEINDFYGNQCGDYVINQLTQALQRLLIEQPSLSTARLYRMPGDELAIWLPDTPRPEVLMQLAQKVQAFIDGRSINWEQQKIPLRVTIGAAATDPSSDARGVDEDLLTFASIALKLARQASASCLVYDPTLKVRESYAHNLMWANRLRKALDEGRIVPWFQPIAETATGRIHKYECLARMIDEDGTPISPQHFLEVAKRIRLYRYITRLMIQQCFARFADTPYEFSLNLSCEDLLDPELTTFVINQLTQTDLAPRVIFEILESEGIENYEAVRQFIDQVKALGCRIAIDDFGTGYSNFEHLLRLNVDIIKIDGSLIKPLATDPTALTVTRGIVQFAAGLGMQTVAEFVHNEAVLEKVRELGIDYAQGYHVGKPSAGLGLETVERTAADSV
ncbi:EAL domain-containing protein [Pseudomonas sp.]|uniref:EAL domain-containing protein n=1 Tax=Pseudomonas sp. TaxID=306 RepID=UPI002729DA11|nr:EAL domain-containing protein [Pseudomonas sp.]